jgi:phenylalanyl-tRNA synthetase alpha chain
MSVIEEIRLLIEQARAFNTSSKDELEQFRLRFLGKKGLLNDFFARLKEVEPSERKSFGQLVNELKQAAEEKVSNLREQLEEQVGSEKQIDPTLPGDYSPLGSRHPIMIVRNQMLSIFNRMGFSIAYGPEMEDDWHNFTALNFPPEHPARDMQDTFFVDDNPDQELYKGPLTLRTHTTSVQVRVMENLKPPFRAVSPGRVYRNEAISARAHCFFHQVDGFYVDEKVSFADLKQTLLTFAKEMFGADTAIRLRPSYFPFTEPSAEVDISCTLCGGKGCNVCKYTGWLEILGCGMIDPNVLENCGIDSKKYSGFAFGMGVERVVMLKYQIKDLRILSENDVRFLSQFKGLED